MPFLLLALTSCIAFQATPTSSPYSEMRKITIVAVEATPPVSTQVNGWVFLGPAYPSVEDADLSLISGALSLIAGDLEDKGAAGEEAPSGALREPWSPALTLAREAAALISSASTSEVVVREKQYTLPSSPRENAHSVLEGWYTRNDPTLSAEELEEGEPSALLELGLSDLSVHEDHLLIHILAKVVDPSSGRVKARSRSRTAVKVGSPEQLFLDGGEKFKSVFAATGRDLLEKNLQAMGLLPKPVDS